jgi:hypothetical protein
LELDHDVTLQKVLLQFYQHAQQPKKVFNVTNLCQNIQQKPTTYSRAATVANELEPWQSSNSHDAAGGATTAIL